MSEVIVPTKKEGTMGVGIKRDHQGKEKSKKDAQGAAATPAVRATVTDHSRNAFTSMFETFRDELDEHHDRRMKIGNVSRQVTALSKKMYTISTPQTQPTQIVFSSLDESDNDSRTLMLTYSPSPPSSIFLLQRVRKLSQPIPEHIQSEIDDRVREIAELLATIQEDVQGMNRHRYRLDCLEEFVEAVSFVHYLRHQTLMTPQEAQKALPANIPLTAPDYVFGIFDLTGEMMRFATAVTALSGHMPTGDSNKDGDEKRTILTDMQDVSSMLQVGPVLGWPNVYAKKLGIMIEQVRKVERLGYGVAVRGNERPKGWMPDLNEAGFPGGGGGDGEDIAMTG